MISEFRLILTGTFVNAADRDACFSSLKTQIQTYNTNNPGKLNDANIGPGIWRPTNIYLTELIQ